MFRFAYAIVDDDEDDYEPVQGANENFGNIAMWLRLRQATMWAKLH